MTSSTPSPGTVNSSTAWPRERQVWCWTWAADPVTLAPEFERPVGRSWPSNLPVTTASVTDIVAFYSVIHLPRRRLRHVLREFARVLTPGGHVLLSAHEGTDDITVTEFLDHQVDLSATFFTLDELAVAVGDADLEVISAERRDPYENEGTTNRLYVQAAKRRPAIRSG